ncbi:MAG: cytochrome c [Nitrospira sp.]|nr:cytochrome c [Nitrospira sp.]MDH4369450.1 cytochrome c [Nitrospira sp.]MDH5347059.1 cytochrome c [Nitrospira sp.]MDH5496374.1 cytochrome c [Nitrospira sp.]MDH5724076.1 cytochrome c [Nitrospira sp.]
MSARSIMMAVVVALLCLPLGYATSRGESSNAKALREHYDLQDGKRLYEQYCRFCHGEQGKGKAYDVTPPPADLTSAAVQQKSDAELTQTIHEGERGTAMGSWKWELSEKDKQNILLYIRRLAR